MAPSFRGRKNLVCFYCNKRSGLQYDGFMSKWDCPQCESTNFLDENGEITDPPVATETSSPGNVRYAIAQPGQRPSSPGSESEPENPLFCKACLKNQHLFTASLAQFDVELDTRDPNFRQREKEYYAFRRRMEKNYPQVCADCEPRVLGRMKEAGMTAKADHLRRMMEKTRARKTQERTNFSLPACIGMAGKTFWYLGLMGQLGWGVGVLVAHTVHTSAQPALQLPAYAIKFLDPIVNVSTSKTWVRNSLVFSIATFWWNPKFHEMNKGFVEHITGFEEWYKIQTLMIISRSIFYFVSGTKLLADPSSAANIGVHLVMLAYLVFLAVKSKQSLKVDHTPLWQSTPERLVKTGTQPDGHRQDTDSLADILDSIADSPTTGHNGLRRPSLSPQNRRFGSPNGTMLHSKTRTAGTNTTSLLDLTKTNFSQRTTFGDHIPTSTQLQHQHHDSSVAGDEMDWTPAPGPVESKHRAFQPVTISEKGSGVFDAGNGSSAFWYKVPPAPITPAQRLRNPPNQPRFQPPSQIRKENYFRDITERVSPNGLQSNRQKVEMEMKPPKFFPPAPASEVGNSLSDLLTSFSLGSPDSESPILVETQYRWGHVGHAVVLALGLLFWSQAFSNPGEHSMKVLLAVMTGCVAIAARTIILHISMVNGESKAARGIGLVLGGIEGASALYGLAEILAGRGETGTCALWGKILLGGMIIQELWHAGSSAR